MKARFLVLSVGSEEFLRTIYGALFGRRQYELITATTYRELFAIPTRENIRIAVLNGTLSREELAAVAQLISWRWPPARILAVCTKAPLIDDVLYDYLFLQSFLRSCSSRRLPVLPMSTSANSTEA